MLITVLFCSVFLVTVWILQQRACKWAKTVFTKFCNSFGDEHATRARLKQSASQGDWSHSLSSEFPPSNSPTPEELRVGSRARGALGPTRHGGPAVVGLLGYCQLGKAAEVTLVHRVEGAATSGSRNEAHVFSYICETTAGWGLKLFYHFFGPGDSHRTVFRNQCNS